MSLDARELRYGNWVVINGSRMQVTALGIHSIGEGASTGDPVPLTPEILDKCGFMSHPVETYYTKNLFDKGGLVGTLAIEMTDYSFAISDSFDTIMETHRFAAGHKLDYLHKLQNLYYALTGQELNYQS